MAWTCHDLHIEALGDDEVAVVAGDRNAIAVTTNHNFVRPARRLRCCPVVYLRVTEEHALAAMKRALTWFDDPSHQLGPGFVLKVPKIAGLSVMPPLPWT